MKYEDIIIIGAVGTAINIAEQINSAFINYNHNQKVVGLCIDSFPVNEEINGIPVLANLSSLNVLLKNKSSLKVLFALFKPDVLKERYQLFKRLNIDLSKLTNFIHPLSYISPSSNLGFGNIILSNSTIQSNVYIGNLNTINSNVCIEHDTQMGEGNFIAANAVIGAKVILGSHNFIGLGSSIRENVELQEVFVGMHSMVISNFKKTRVFGIPAKPR